MSKKTEKNHSQVIRDSWKDPDVRDARAARHRVKVAGTEYRSVRAAFEALELPMSQHAAFRRKLKEGGKKTFEYEGEKYDFAIVE